MNTKTRERSKVRGLKLVIGEGPCPKNAALEMIGRLATHARSVGLTVVKVIRSKTIKSNSHYLLLRDGAQRDWVVRVADHHAPLRAAIANVDLVTRDGTRGQDWAEDCISAIAVGAVDWFDSEATARAPSAKELKLIEKGRKRRC
jgi:hypothetical protein